MNILKVFFAVFRYGRKYKENYFLHFFKWKKGTSGKLKYFMKIISIYKLRKVFTGYIGSQNGIQM